MRFPSTTEEWTLTWAAIAAFASVFALAAMLFDVWGKRKVKRSAQARFVAAADEYARKWREFCGNRDWKHFYEERPEIPLEYAIGLEPLNAAVVAIHNAGAMLDPLVRDPALADEVERLSVEARRNLRL